MSGCQHLIRFLAFVLLAYESAATLLAQDRSGKSGSPAAETPDTASDEPAEPIEVVITLRDIELKVEKRVIETVPAGEELWVEKINGDWLWVASADENHGWVKREDVASAYETSKSTEELKVAALGSFSAAHVTTLYYFLDTLAVAFLRGDYSADETRNILRTQKLQICLLRAVANGLAERGLHPADRTAILHLVSIYAQINHAIDRLSAYTQSRAQADFDAYSKSRNAAWSSFQSGADE